MKGRLKILLVHLVANGDCLMATAIAKQVKKDYPDCHLTWAISFKCSQIIRGNPDVDEIMEIKYGETDSPFGNVWYKLKEEIKQSGYDKVFYTQIYPDNDWCYDGTTRSSTFRAYPGKITVSVQPELLLSSDEIEKVKLFAEKYRLSEYSNRIIFECAPGSGQSAMTLELALAISRKLIDLNASTIIIISTYIHFNSDSDRIINGAELSLRENAALSHHCNFLVGCSSGISWLLTSNAAKKLPSIQVLNGKAFGFRFASMKYDFEYFRLDHSHIIETDVCNADETPVVIHEALLDFKAAALKYNKRFTPGNDYCIYLAVEKVRNAEYKKAMKVLSNFTARNGFRPGLYITFLKSVLKLPFISQDKQRAKSNSA